MLVSCLGFFPSVKLILTYVALCLKVNGITSYEGLVLFS